MLVGGTRIAEDVNRGDSGRGCLRLCYLDRGIPLRLS